MATLGAATGGPIGMKPDSLGGGNDGNKALLNTCIHNYFVGEGLADIAKQFRNSRLNFKNEFMTKEDSIDTDTKDDSGNRSEGGLGGNIPGGADSTSFLPNWWAMFCDMWFAAKHKEMDTPAAQFLALTQRARQQQQSFMMQNQAMIGPNFHRFSQLQPQMEMPKRAMVNNGRMPAGMNNMNRLQQMGVPSQMQRDGSDIDLSGAPRGQSPMPGENPSSPKRQRVDNGTFNPQMVPNGRPQGMAAQPPNGSAPNANMLMTTGFDPQNAMLPNFAQPNGMSKNAQQLYAQEMASQTQKAMHGIPKGALGLTGMPQNSPMIPSGPDGQMLPIEGFTSNAGRNNMTGGNGGALADYQMQLMLLEQQNKKRLMMARQEQDVAQGRDQGGVGPPGLMGQQNFAPAMSPRASRAGHSPGSNDPTKRGTPKMSQDSPLPDSSMGPGRNSPGGANFEAGQMPGNIAPFTLNNGMIGRPGGQHTIGGPMIPTQLELLRQQQQQQQQAQQQQNMRMVNNAWPPGMQNAGGQMLPQGQGIMQPNQMDSNPHRNNMPPPQGPANGRTQPPSPQPTAVAPPTPSQANKAAPKKKDTKDKPKKPAKKAATTAATPSEVEQQDEVPPTPNTPKNRNSSIIKGPPPSNHPTNMNMPPQPPTSMPPSAMTMNAPPDNPMVPPFAGLNEPSEMPNFGDFEDILGHDNTDVLHGFDFDAFLHNDPVPGFDFDAPYLNGDNSLETMGD